MRHCGQRGRSGKAPFSARKALSQLRRHRLPLTGGVRKGRGAEPGFLMPWLHQVRMISEELVASGGTQVRGANIPEKSPKATAVQEPRVSMVLCGSPGYEGLPRPSFPGRLQGSREFWRMSPGDSLQCPS